jgi:putative hydrolase of HD superfamily
MEKEVYNLVPTQWYRQIKMFTEEEFISIVTIKGKTMRKTSEEISGKYNSDAYNPRDGEVVKALDDLAAFVEAHTALENGVKSKDLEEAVQSIRKKYRNAIIGRINVGTIYADLNK